MRREERNSALLLFPVPAEGAAVATQAVAAATQGTGAQKAPWRGPGTEVRRLAGTRWTRSTHRSKEPPGCAPQRGQMHAVRRGKEKKERADLKGWGEGQRGSQMRPTHGSVQRRDSAPHHHYLGQPAGPPEAANAIVLALPPPPPLLPPARATAGSAKACGLMVTLFVLL